MYNLLTSYTCAPKTWIQITKGDGRTSSNSRSPAVPARHVKEQDDKKETRRRKETEEWHQRKPEPQLRRDNFTGTQQKIKKKENRW